MPQTLRIEVGGMTCAACQSHVQRALEQTQGVDKAAVSLMTNEAVVVFDPQIVDPDKLLEAIRDTGYDAALPANTDAIKAQEAKEQAEIKDARDLAVKAIVSLILGGLAMTASMS